MNRLLSVIAALTVCAVAAEAQNASIGTNVMDYADFGTLNAEASLGVARHWSVNAAVRYNPFSYSGGSGDMGMQNRQQMYSAGVRYWPWYNRKNEMCKI